MLKVLTNIRKQRDFDTGPLQSGRSALLMTNSQGSSGLREPPAPPDSCEANSSLLLPCVKACGILLSKDKPHTEHATTTTPAS